MLPFTYLILAAISHQAPPSPAPTHRAYVQASLFASVRPADGYRILHIDRNLSGTTVALSMAAGARVSRSLGVEGEFVYGGSIAARQVFNYTTSEAYTAENQQVLVSALLRYRAGASSGVEIVGGGGYGRSIDRHTAVTITDEAFRSSAGPDSIQTRNALTLTAGMDVRLGVAPHVALVPGVRLRWLRGLPAGHYISGAGAWTFEFGAGVRVR